MGRGRPLKEIGKKNWKISLRLDNECQRMLVYLMEKTGESKPDILRNGLRMYYNLKKSLD